MTVHLTQKLDAIGAALADEVATSRRLAAEIDQRLSRFGLASTRPSPVSPQATATVEQLTLDLRPLTKPLYTPGMTLDQRFTAFHTANPHVADALESLAAQWLSRHSKVGVKSLGESLRWASGIQTDGDPYRINNSYLSRYARLLIERHPEWADAIETRALAAERAA